MRIERAVVVACGFAVALTGCFDPTVAQGRPCGADGSCPSGQACVIDTCWATAMPDAAGTDAGNDPDARAIDAGPDGPPGDRDNDLVADDDDNCPDVANANQHDEDADLVGDVCDNCPHLANPGQANVMEAVPDTVGDACDPRPTITGDRIDRFLPFDTLPSDLTKVGSWSIVSDAARQTSSGDSGLELPGLRDRVTIEIGGTADTLSSTEMFVGVAGSAVGTSLHDCGFYDVPGDYHVGFGSYYNGTTWTNLTEEHVQAPLAVNVPFTVRLSVDSTTGQLGCATSDPRAIRSFTSAAPMLVPGTVGIVGYGARYRIRYLIVFGQS